MKKLLLIFISVLGIISSGYNAMAQKEGSNLSLGADFVSRYIWRGINLGGSSSHVQPYIEYGVGNSGLAIGAWGSHPVDAFGSGAEADLYVSYSPIEMFTVTITDYYFPVDIAFGRDKYFNYDKDQTGHTFEGMIGFNGTETIPVTAIFAMNFYGADGTDENGDNYLAKYLEFGYSTSMGETDLSTFVGLALDDPKEENGAIGWYGNSAGVINIGLSASREIKVTETHTIPITSSLIFNPEAENIYLVFGISF